MTEEIIIDGVNVAGCDFYELCGCIDDNHELNECKDNPNCYYKQLKRLKEINRIAQATIDDGKEENKRFREENQRLKQENRELQAYKDVNEDFKKAWDKLNKKYNEVLSLAKRNADSNEYCLQELEKENEELKKGYEKRGEIMKTAALQRDNYRSALEEIKNCINTYTSVDNDFENSESYLRVMLELEVLDEN